MEKDANKTIKDVHPRTYVTGKTAERKSGVGAETSYETVMSFPTDNKADPIIATHTGTGQVGATAIRHLGSEEVVFHTSSRSFGGSSGHERRMADAHRTRPEDPFRAIDVVRSDVHELRLEFERASESTTRVLLEVQSQQKDMMEILQMFVRQRSPLAPNITGHDTREAQAIAQDAQRRAVHGIVPRQESGNDIPESSVNEPLPTAPESHPVENNGLRKMINDSLTNIINAESDPIEHLSIERAGVISEFRPVHDNSLQQAYIRMSQITREDPEMSTSTSGRDAQRRAVPGILPRQESDNDIPECKRAPAEEVDDEASHSEVQTSNDTDETTLGSENLTRR